MTADEGAAMSNVTGVDLAANQDGRLELVATTGSDESESGHVFHAWQVEPGGDWSGWHLLGQPSEVAYSRPAVAEHADGRLHVVVNDLNRQVRDIEQWEPNDGWSEWGVVGPSELKFLVPELARNHDGRLEVFAVAYRDGWSVWHAWRGTAAPGGDWSGWHSFGPPGSGATAQVAVAANADGRLELCSAEGPDKGSKVVYEGRMFHRYQLKAGGGWSDWDSLGGGAGFEADTPVLGRNADGRLELFTSAAGVIWHAWQRDPADSTSWSGWVRLRHDTELLGRPAVAADADGRLIVFATSDRGKLWRREQNPGGDGWQPSWVLMGNVASGKLQDPDLAMNVDGRLELVARTNPAGDLYHLVQLEPGGGWPSTGRRWRHP